MVRNWFDSGPNSSVDSDECNVRVGLDVGRGGSRGVSRDFGLVVVPSNPDRMLGLGIHEGEQVLRMGGSSIISWSSVGIIWSPDSLFIPNLRGRALISVSIHEDVSEEEHEGPHRSVDDVCLRPKHLCPITGGQNRCYSHVPSPIDGHPQ